MSDSFIYSCLAHLMSIIQAKEGNSGQAFYSTHIIVTHFMQSKQLFQNNSLFYQTMLNFYHQLYVRFDKDNNEGGENKGWITEVCNEGRRMKPEQQSVERIIIRVMTMGIKTIMGVDIDCQLHRQIIYLCNDLHQTLAFQGHSISQILLKFISPLSKSINNLFFYENLLKIFITLDFYQIINFLQSAMREFRQDWQKKQKQIQSSAFKGNRQTRLMMSIKRSNVSLGQDGRGGKENRQVRQNVMSVSKIVVQRPMLIPPSNAKRIIPTSKRVPPSSSRRRTFNIDRAYKFNNRQTNSNFHESIIPNSSLERQHKVKKQNHSWKDVGYENCGRDHGGGGRYLGGEGEDVLADSTPNKKKKIHNKGG